MASMAMARFIAACAAASLMSITFRAGGERVRCRRERLIDRLELRAEIADHRWVARQGSLLELARIRQRRAIHRCLRDRLDLVVETHDRPEESPRTVYGRLWIHDVLEQVLHGAHNPVYCAQRLIHDLESASDNSRQRLVDGVQRGDIIAMIPTPNCAGAGRGVTIAKISTNATSTFRCSQNHPRI